MKFLILTLFPELFTTFSKYGIVSRAIQQGHISLEAQQLRQFAINNQGQVDDTPYGGGSGMVLRVDAAHNAILAATKVLPSAKRVLLSPRGKPLNQKLCRSLAHSKQDLILLCNRYEGVDQRIINGMIDEEICIGDFVTMGGEIPAMALIESLTRLLPGVLGNQSSIEDESFEQNLLEHDHYTKPASFAETNVPQVLSSGDHQAIKDWRKKNSLLETCRRRPDLIRPAHIPEGSVSLALIHSPVIDKQGKTITSSITNLDLHDIARSSRTFGIKNFYVVHPTKTLRRLAERICDHWKHGYGLQYNANRGEALATIRLSPNFDDVLIRIEDETGSLPVVVMTSAHASKETLSYKELRAQITADDKHYLILFGTGWGLSPQISEKANLRLEPICGPTEYNHLSVRAAAAITLDRIFGND